MIIVDNTSIEYQDDLDNIYLCGGKYIQLTPLSIKYLDSLLKVIIANREEVKNAADTICIGRQYIEYYPVAIDVNLQIDEDLIILWVDENMQASFIYKGEKNQFPVRWFTKEIREKLGYPNILQDKINKRVYEVENFCKRNWFQKILDFIF